MKTIFIGAKIRKEPNYEEISKVIDKSIPEKKIAICYSNQFAHIAKKLPEFLKKEVVQKIQILGCSNPQFSKEVESILIVGQGKFHSVSLAYETKLPTYILEDEKIEKISAEDVEKMEKKERGMYLKYLESKKIGILITNKPGQQRLKSAINYFKALKDKEGKKDPQGNDVLRVKRVFVTTGDQKGNYTVIKKGIKAGQEVVSTGELKLQNGTRVIVNNDMKLDDASAKALGE